MHDLYDIVIWIGTGVILVSFIIALYITKKDIPDYLKKFYLVPLITLLISANTILGAYINLYPKKLSILATIQNTLSLFDFIFWGFFFCYWLKQNSRFIFFSFFLIIILLRVSMGFSKVGFEIHAITNFGKTLFCIFYFYELFKAAPKLNLKNHPSFWIVTGLFFYSCISFPEYAVDNYLRTRLPREISRNLFSSTNIAIIIMHLLFIKAYLCSIRQPRAF